MPYRSRFELEPLLTSYRTVLGAFSIFSIIARVGFIDCLYNAAPHYGRHARPASSIDRRDYQPVGDGETRIMQTVCCRSTDSPPSFVPLNDGCERACCFGATAATKTHSIYGVCRRYISPSSPSQSYIHTIKVKNATHFVSSRRSSCLEQSSAACLVSTVTDCFPESAEDSPLQSFFPLTHLTIIL